MINRMDLKEQKGHGNGKNIFKYQSNHSCSGDEVKIRDLAYFEINEQLFMLVPILVIKQNNSSHSKQK